ncbi:DUF2130 domain-containing protein [Bradyrhizobium sp. CCGUVB14]|uniref:DUF2130 domain-containing protein n=1 Tax=Bradyrhizobium sp. CCGUVB14 TaxID=2949628 RepID=UPI0020B3097D|nr:DUF2130 domain-containing protein [Bradyrhizobium sp. CCGUVB14]MCP3439794.1 DUF2130 domain-containing protein [Bradyrhizobium sp. CCGUVB14]
MATQPAFSPPTAPHIHVSGETCPYCQQEIPNERVAEIRERYEADQQRQEKEFAARLDAQVSSIRIQFDEARKADIAALNEQHATAIAQQKAESVLQQNAAREEGKKLADSALQQQIELLTTAQTASAEKAQEAEQKRLEAVGELTTFKAQQEATIKLARDEVRTAMEAQKLEDINAVNAKNAAEAKVLNEKIAALQKLVDAEEADGVDIKVLEHLKKAYPKDDFRVVGKNTGAEIIHTVRSNNKKACGTIVYDTRSRDIWSSKFASNLRQDMVAEKANHAVLVTGKLQKGAGHVQICDGVVCVKPTCALAIADILRNEIVHSHSQRLSAEGRERKTEHLYTYITSDGFTKLLESMEGTDEKLLKLEEDEQKAHKAMWSKRGSLLKSQQRDHAKMREQIEAIIESSIEE